MSFCPHVLSGLVLLGTRTQKRNVSTHVRLIPNPRRVGNQTETPMPQTRIDDLSTDDKLNILASNLDRIEAQLLRLEEGLENVIEKLDNLNLNVADYDVIEGYDEYA